MKKVLFLGNPNVGKSALINTLSGSKLSVGNWPGVTVARKEAYLKIDNEDYYLLDLPGIYELGQASAEERITAKALKEDKPDLIVNVADITNLERNLYLTLNLRECQIPMILVLNFADKVDSKVINIQKLSKILQMPVIAVSAAKNFQINELKILINDAASKPIIGEYFRIAFGGSLEKEIVELSRTLSSKQSYAEQSSYIINMLRNPKKISGSQADIATFEISRAKLMKEYQNNIENIFQIEHYKMVNLIINEVVRNPNVAERRWKITKSIDKLFLNKYLGLPMFLLIMFLATSFIFNFSAPLITWAENLVKFIIKYLDYLISFFPSPLKSLILDGIVGGIGGILSFIPLLFLVFIFTAILEESGYISRVAFLLDRIMRPIGISGKSFIPLILGFGCTVSAVHATRSLEDERAKKITAAMLPFMSCGARIPIYTLIGVAFFGPKVGVVILLLYLLGILLAVIVASFLHLVLLKKKEESELIIELPPYHLPSFRLIIRRSIQETRNYIAKAGKIIAIVMIILWFLSFYPNNGAIEQSFLAYISHYLTFIFKPLGWGESWELVASLPGALAGKEAVVGFLSQLYRFNEQLSYQSFNLWGDLVGIIKNLFIAFGQGLKNFVTFDFIKQFHQNQGSGLADFSRQFFKGPNASLKAFSFLAYILTMTPCVASISAIKTEFGRKFSAKIFLLTIIIPYILSLIIYNLGLLLA